MEARQADHRCPREDLLDAAMRIQQFTGPVMAKGLEDTALYRYNRHIALSDVGSHPDRFTTSIAAFHDFNAARARTMPNGMLATSSHDTKRSEDARARIAALGRHAEAWSAAVGQWQSTLVAEGAPPIAPNDAYHFFQLLVGSWPTTLEGTDCAGIAAFRDRLDAAMLKSVREARMHTNWIVPRSDYEQQVSRFVATALGSRRFVDAVLAFEAQVARDGARNGLIVTVLKATSPGIPDIYQGAEFWEQSMVDPDNRRPVDFAARIAALDNPARPGDVADGWRTGAIKQRVLADLLALRARHPDLFARGSYEPLPQATAGTLAFLRRHDGVALLVAVQLQVAGAGDLDPDRLRLPSGLARDAFEPVLALGDGGPLGRLPVHAAMAGDRSR